MGNEKINYLLMERDRVEAHRNALCQEIAEVKNELSRLHLDIARCRTQGKSLHVYHRGKLLPCIIESASENYLFLVVAGRDKIATFKELRDKEGNVIFP